TSVKFSDPAQHAVVRPYKEVSRSFAKKMRAHRTDTGINDHNVQAACLEAGERILKYQRRRAKVEARNTMGDIHKPCTRCMGKHHPFHNTHVPVLCSKIGKEGHDP
ncbi:unnamed protein product, partial [marine sediment metagenome]